MNPEDTQIAYRKCQEITLSDSNIVPSEGETISFILIRITDTGPKIGISSILINPAIPDKGGVKEFIDMTDDQAVGVLALPEVTQTVRRAHERLDKFKDISRDDPAKAVEQLVNFMKKRMTK
jgi:hypothetical protein